MNIDNSYDIIQTPKLIDINGTLTKFESNFKVTSDSPFYIAVLNQKMLDEGDIKFRQPDVQSSGTVKYDRDEHLPHFIALKADSPMKVNVQVNTVPLESPIKLQDYQPQNQHPTPRQVTQLEPSQSLPSSQQLRPIIHNHKPTLYQPPPTPQKQVRFAPQKSQISPFVIIGVIAVVFGAIFIFSKMKKPTSKAVGGNIKFPFLNHKISAPSQPPSSDSPSPQLSLPPSLPPSLPSVPQLPQVGGDSLLDKIKSFPIS